jgi:hypothetical protein
VVPLVFWILAIAAIPVWNALDPGNGWDAKVYLNAIRSIKAGHDPYADGIAAQTAFHNALVRHPHASPPYAYIYPPITLPLLRVIGEFRPAFLEGGYWLIYAAAVLAQIWASMQATESKERRYFAYAAPAAAFFPGLLQHDSVMSGNIAFILYGVVFVTAFWGWRRGRWRWFYLVTLAASCVKVPLLSLLAIPVLLTRRQWVPACTTGVAGVAIFLMQAWIWPSYFHNFLRALDLEFSYNRAFGVGPAGLFGLTLFDAGMQYSRAATIAYFLCAIPLFGLLLYLSRQFLDGKFSLEQWIPVMFTGVILLNPRIMEYDVAPLAVFMALILSRSIAALTGFARAILLSSLFFIGINLFVIPLNTIDIDDFYWNHIEGLLLASLFAAGCWNLLRQTRGSRRSGCPPDDEFRALESSA